MKTFLIIGITLVAGLFIAGAFAVSTAGSTPPPSAAVLIDKTITANGIYDASDDGADGFSQVTVNVPARIDVFDCGGNTNIGTAIVLNRIYYGHFGDNEATGELILNVCGVYWNVRENRISLDNGTTWLDEGISRSTVFVSSDYPREVWQIVLVNLPNYNGITVVSNTLEYVNLSEYYASSCCYYQHEYHESNDPTTFIEITDQNANLGGFQGGVTSLSLLVDEEIYD